MMFNLEEFFSLSFLTWQDAKETKAGNPEFNTLSLTLIRQMC